MHKEESEKSKQSDVEFPVGDWPIFIRTEYVYIGHLNFAKSPNSPGQYVGALRFDENPQFGDIANLPYPVENISFDTGSGHINFDIASAALQYDPSTTGPYWFVFDGDYEAGELQGTVGVPKDFGKVPGPPGGDGDNVTWTSKGPGDPKHKPSK